jgi:peptidoglycan DL-endopeptidase LytE
MKIKWIVPFLTLFLVFTVSEKANAEHYVKPGENMWKIAQKYGMSVSDLISLNPHIPNPNIIHANDYIVIRTTDQKAKDLTGYARSLQSVTAYQYGGNNPPYETDCSGWVQHIYKKFGVNLPRTSREQAALGKHVTFQELEIGDLMFFSTRNDKVITHVGINLGNDYFISNLNETKDVEILSNWGTWTQKYFLWGARHKL